MKKISVTSGRVTVSTFTDAQKAEHRRVSAYLFVRILVYHLGGTQTEPDLTRLYTATRTRDMGVTRRLAFSSERGPGGIGGWRWRLGDDVLVDRLIRILEIVETKCSTRNALESEVNAKQPITPTHFKENRLPKTDSAVRYFVAWSDFVTHLREG